MPGAVWRAIAGGGGGLQCYCCGWEGLVGGGEGGEVSGGEVGVYLGDGGVGIGGVRGMDREDGLGGFCLRRGMGGLVRGCFVLRTLGSERFASVRACFFGHTCTFL